MRTFSYQNKRKKNYFEGWYTRFNTEDGIEFAVIFAVTKYEKDPHSFIQVFKENDKKCVYLKYKVEDFSFNDGVVSIKNNQLSFDKLIVKTDNIDINIEMSNQETLTDLGLRQSAMGILENAPLECFQEVVFMNGVSKGTCTLGNKKYDINGTTYMEKTYGSKFPTKWIWIQSNKNKENSISFSIGKVPVLGKIAINGFLCVLRTVEKSYYFSTSNFSRIKIAGTADKPIIILNKKGYKLKLFPTKSDDVLLVGPTKKGQMILDVFESINSNLEIKLYYKNKQILHEKFEKVGYEQMYL